MEIFPWLRKRSFEKALKISKIGFFKLIEFIETFNGKFTFFVNGEFVSKWPRIFDLIPSKVEIASHGFSHPFKFYSLKKVRVDIENITKLLNSYGIKPKGYRFPNMQFNEHFLKILEEFGYKYDSSLHPTLTYKYCHVLKDDKPFKIGKILEIPITISSFKLPLSWFWWEKYPNFLQNLLVLPLLKKKYVVLYFHNWNFINHSFLSSLNSLIEKLDELNFKLIHLYFVYRSFE